MARYFTRPRVRAYAPLWVEDESYRDAAHRDTPQVCDHEATDTGLLDVRGDAIWRGPNPIGFLWDID